MTSAPDPNSGSVASDPYRDLREEFRKIDERLHDMVDEYDEEPSSIGGGVLARDDDETNVTSAVKQAYKLMKTRIYAEDSPLRANPDVWEAFEQQRDELRIVYRTALDELETFKEILESYDALKAGLLSRGEPKKLQETEQALRDQRGKCIDAFIIFCRKFSGMLTGF